MAIYHFSAQIISRGKGQSAVASASYRSGEKLIDEQTGEAKFYNREIQPETMILSPSHAPEWVADRQRLWNEVEKIEKNKNSQLAREINIALPVELSNEQQKELIKDYAQEHFVNRGMVADISIHRDDKNNPHAHVMLTIRQFDENGEWGNKKKKVYELDQEGNKVLDKNEKPKYKTYSLTDWDKKETLEQWREGWANHLNKALEREGIQERVSHLSHEERGLEQLPTVHLGHVASEIEKRGVQTIKGNINRDREEYNATVIDLKKYREEKQALEQSKGQQGQNEKVFTAEEKTILQNASKILKTKPTLQNITKRREQLDKWEERTNKGDSYLRWKDQEIRKASEHFSWINSFEKQIQGAEKRIENINWINPLKIKENRAIKEKAEQEISRAKSEIQFHDEKLNYQRVKLGFNNEKEFNQVKIQHEADRPGLLEKNMNTRKQINHERDILQKAENAHKNAFVRQVANLYPKRPEMAYMSPETALKIAQLNKAQGKVVPIESIEKTLNSKKQEIQRLEGEISRVDQTKSRLQRAGDYLNKFEKHQAIVEKHENNPFLKWKMPISKSVRREYEDSVTARNSYQNLMNKEGTTGRADYEKQISVFNKMESKVPEFKGQIQSQEKGFGLLNAIMKGIEQAGREMTREKQRQQQRAKGKGKNRQQTWERDER